MNIEEKKDWIALNLLSYKKPDIFIKLHQHYGSGTEILKAGRSGFQDIEWLDNKKKSSIISILYGEIVDKELEVIEKQRVQIITVEDEDYPELLREISAPPPVLYCRGNLKKEFTGIAVVGTRNPTEYGKMMAEKLSSQLAINGIAVVSGMARGIDTIAHKSALGSNGYTIAVLGSGIDMVYPPENGKLYNEICEKGAVISEFPMGSSPHKKNFPRRNRIVSGMSRAILVIEAGERSGTLITARFAIEQNRDVFAVPGRVTSSRSKGTNGLIKKGAILTESFDDIAEHLGVEFKREFSENSTRSDDKDSKKPIAFSEDSVEAAVLSFLDDSPKHIDLISRECGMGIPQISSILMKLEIYGAVRQVSGKMFVRNYL